MLSTLRGAATAVVMILALQSGSVAAEIASYYGMAHQGRRTASGRRFCPLGLSAASRTLPLGAKVRVTNRENGKSVEVTILDRGPALRTHRTIDLSLGAARRLGMVRQGVASVQIERIR